MGTKKIFEAAKEPPVGRPTSCRESGRNSIKRHSHVRDTFSRLIGYHKGAVGNEAETNVREVTPLQWSNLQTAPMWNGDYTKLIELPLLLEKFPCNILTEDSVMTSPKTLA